MRDFFIVSYDSSREDLEVVTHYDMVDFDLRAFWTGKRFESSIPSSVRLWVSRGEASDYLANPLSWEIVSERFWAITRPFVEKTCQLFPVPLYYENSNTPVRGYALMNPLSSLAATRNEADVTVDNLCLNKERIPDDVHLFRLAESSTLLIVSDVFVKAVWGKKLKGVAFLKTRVE